MNHGDHTIDGVWSGTIKTVGTVELKSGGIMRDGNVVAGDIVVAGNAKGCTMFACRTLQLCKGAEVDFRKITVRDLLIEGGGKFVVSHKVVCQNLDVRGDLRAKVFTGGVAVIRHGGVLRGELHSPHLIVEDGGGLRAKVSAGAGTAKAGQSNNKRP